MKTLAIIPARYASTRFPGKPLVHIQGKSMIQRVCEQAKAAKLVDEVIVATDDQRIYNHVLGFGAQVMMTSKEHPSGTDRCGEVAAQFPEVDAVINIQGDEPFVPPAMIDELIRTFQDDQEQKIATLVRKLDHIKALFSVDTVKVVINQQGKAMYFSRHPIPFQRDMPRKDWLAHHEYFQHIGMYMFDRKTLLDLVQLPASALELQERLEQLRWLENGYKIGVGLTELASHGVDRPEDLERYQRKES